MIAFLLISLAAFASVLSFFLLSVEEAYCNWDPEVFDEEFEDLLLELLPLMDAARSYLSSLKDLVNALHELYHALNEITHPSIFIDVVNPAIGVAILLVDATKTTKTMSNYQALYDTVKLFFIQGRSQELIGVFMEAVGARKMMKKAGNWTEKRVSTEMVVRGDTTTKTHGTGLATMNFFGRHRACADKYAVVPFQSRGRFLLMKELESAKKFTCESRVSVEKQLSCDGLGYPQLYFGMATF